MDAVTAAMIYQTLSPIIPVAAAAVVFLAVLLLIYRKFNQLMKED
jgi:CHASE2 domain-containing sensor protein